MKINGYFVFVVRCCLLVETLTTGTLCLWLAVVEVVVSIVGSITKHCLGREQTGHERVAETEPKSIDNNPYSLYIIIITLPFVYFAF